MHIMIVRNHYLSMDLVDTSAYLVNEGTYTLMHLGHNEDPATAELNLSTRIRQLARFMAAAGVDAEIIDRGVETLGEAAA